MNKIDLPKSYFNLLIKLEGGYVNNPNDRGKETKYGITEGLLKRIGHNYGINNVSQLTLELAYDIYNNEYWNKFSCYLYPHYLDFVVFDSFVNHGIRGAKYRLKEYIQRLILTLPTEIEYKKVITDINKINQLNYEEQKRTILNYYLNQAIHPLILADELLIIRMNFYHRFINKYRKQKVFLEGWIRRLRIIMEELPKLEK